MEEILATKAIKRNQIDDKIQLSCSPVSGDHRRVPPRNGGEQRRARAGAVGVVYIRGLLESPFNREVTFPVLAGVGTVRVVALLQDSGAGHVLGVSLQKL